MEELINIFNRKTNLFSGTITESVMEIVEEYDFNPHKLRHARESPFAIRAIPSFRSGISAPEAKPLALKILPQLENKP